nr:transposase [Fundidesulfovibrio terrae]
MRKSRFSETQLVGMLKQAEAGRPASDICRENGISSTTFNKWKTICGGMDASDARRLKEIEAEHNRLKQMFAGLSQENQALKGVIANKW